MNRAKKPPILLVDDEPDMLSSLKELLRLDFQIHTAEGGNQALAVLRQHPVHVIMSDQRMPEMTGVELLRRVAQEYPQVVRIMFTGYADIKAVIEGINHVGLYRYITKPWDPDELLEVLRAAAARYEAAAETRLLLADVRAYLRQGEGVVQQLRAADGGTVPAGVEEWAAAAGPLAQRLDRAAPA